MREIRVIGVGLAATVAINLAALATWQPSAFGPSTQLPHGESFTVTRGFEPSLSADQAWARFGATIGSEARSLPALYEARVGILRSKQADRFVWALTARCPTVLGTMGPVITPPSSCHFWRFLDATTGALVEQFESNATVV